MVEKQSLAAKLEPREGRPPPHSALLPPPFSLVPPRLAWRSVPADSGPPPPHSALRPLAKIGPGSTLAQKRNLPRATVTPTLAQKRNLPRAISKSNLQVNLLQKFQLRYIENPLRQAEN